MKQKALATRLKHQRSFVPTKCPKYIKSIHSIQYNYYTNWISTSIISHASNQNLTGIIVFMKTKCKTWYLSHCSISPMEVLINDIMHWQVFPNTMLYILGCNFFQTIIQFSNFHIQYNQTWTNWIIGLLFTNKNLKG